MNSTRSMAITPKISRPTPAAAIRAGDRERRIGGEGGCGGIGGEARSGGGAGEGFSSSRPVSSVSRMRGRNRSRDSSVSTLIAPLRPLGGEGKNEVMEREASCEGVLQQEIERLVEIDMGNA